MDVSTDKPIYELELAVWFDAQHVTHGLMDKMPPALADGLRRECAEVSIPYHIDGAVYAFTCFIAGVHKGIPAINEMAILYNFAPRLYQTYAEHFKPMEVQP